MLTGQWMKKRDWKVSHFVRGDKRTKWMGHETGWAACGSCVSIDEYLEAEPTGIDTVDRCGRCERRRLKMENIESNSVAPASHRVAIRGGSDRETNAMLGWGSGGDESDGYTNVLGRSFP